MDGTQRECTYRNASFREAFKDTMFNQEVLRSPVILLALTTAAEKYGEIIEFDRVGRMYS